MWYTSLMSAEILALLASMGWAADAILVRKGALFADVSAAALLSFVVTACLLWTVEWSYGSYKALYSPAIPYFILSGLIQPALVRVLYYTGIVRLGVSRAGPVRGVTPLFALALAFLALGERPGLLVYLAALLIVAGVWLTSYRRAGEAHWRLFDLSFPLGAALLAAVSQIIRKAGLLILPGPIFGAAVTTTTSLIVFPFTLLAAGKIRSIRINRHCLPFYGSAAFVSAIAQLFTFAALSRGEVSVVVTINNTNPLFVVLFSAAFLRDVEKLNRAVVIGVVLLVVGLALIVNR